jgi:hypothetical protein
MESERKSRYELFLEEEARKAQPTKRCSKCGETKALSAFYNNAHNKDGKSWWCKKCSLATRPRKYKNRTDRFWKYYHTHTINVGNCVEWVGHDSYGYAMHYWNGKKTPVARTVYSLSVRPVSDDEIVFRICDNKRCVRHSHLRLGTKTDGMVKLYNYRSCRGERNYSAKLTENDVRMARSMYAERVMSIRELSSKFGVTYGTMLRVVKYKIWTHVSDHQP